jgi:hypothetical protein
MNKLEKRIDLWFHFFLTTFQTFFGRKIAKRIFLSVNLRNETDGLMLNRTTLSNWVITCAIRYVLPLIDRMHEPLMKRDIIYADETVIQVLHEEGRKAAQKSYMWLICSGKEDNLPRIVIYSYRPTRAGENAKELLEGFEGHFPFATDFAVVTGLFPFMCLLHVLPLFFRS